MPGVPGEKEVGAAGTKSKILDGAVLLIHFAEVFDFSVEASSRILSRNISSQIST